MSALKLLLCWAFVSSCVLPVLPQSSSNFVCDQFTLNPSVGPRPENPLIIPEGGSQTITCNHDTIGLNGIVWNRESSAIREDFPEGSEGCSCRNAPPDETPGTRELTFTDFHPNSAGVYSCRVPVPFMNGVFNICQFDVLVAVRPSVDNLPPSRSYTVNRDSTLTIPAMVSGLPFPDITWRQGSTLLSNSSRVTINGATGALTVTGMTPLDRGDYNLSLNNSAGPFTISISVFVRFVEIIATTNPVSVGNDRIAITCSGRGYPDVIVEWLDHNRNIIQVDTEVSFTHGTFERTSTNTLTIERAQCQDPYTCVVRSEEGDLPMSTRRTIRVCSELASLPRPMDVLVVQNGRDSVRVSWTIRDADLVNSYEVFYNDGTGEQMVEVPSSPDLSTTITGLTQGVEYTFRVVSVRGTERNESMLVMETLVDCTQAISNKVFGVNIGTAVNTNGQRTFNISWTVPQENIVTGYKVMSEQGWENIVNPRLVTNLLTPANFCNGQDHKFVVMATNNCGEFGPPSATVVGNCDTLSQIMISSVKAYGTAITVKWNLKSGTLIQSPLTITVLEIQLNSNGQQLRLNYSVSDIIDEAECLGGLKNSTDYRVCLHPVYANGMTEVEPVCTDVATEAMETEANFVGSCTKPESMTLVGSTVNQIPIPDYAIALIVVGALIIVSLVFCFIGICFACNNSRNKNIDDLGSEYSSSIGGGMQGRMSNNHNRNMSPTRSCLSYHSKGHSTNWNDHMGTLREMETEVGTNV